MNSTDILQHDLPFFEGLTAADLAGIDVDAQCRTYAPWEIIFNQNDRDRDVYFLLSGRLLAVHWTEDGREVIFTSFNIGSCFGELAALDDQLRSLAVVARSEVTVVALRQAVFLQLFHEVRLFRERVTAALVGRVRSLTERNVQLTTFTVEQRVASYLIAAGMERACLEDGGVMIDAPTHGDIAATIGANREIVSRTMARLSRRGAIRTARQQIEFRNLSMLMRAL